MTVIIPLLNNFYKFSVRLQGIDTCEISSDSEPNRILATNARNRLIQLVTNNTASISDVKLYLFSNISLVYLKCQDFDKYGRVLASISKCKEDPENFSQVLIREKLAYSYDGKKKLSEEDQINLLR